MLKQISVAVAHRCTFILLTLLLLTSSTAFASKDDFGQLPPGRTVASVGPADLTPTHVDGGLPLYELGFGLGGALNSHYPGSDQSQFYALPIPFAVYRGRILRSDRGGTRAKLLSRTGFDLSFSGSGAFPVKSNNDSARAGMSDLGWMVQLGPKVRVELKSWDDGASLRGGLSARSSYSADDINSIVHRGFVYQLELVYQKPNFFAERLDLFSSLSSIFASEKYMDYVYGVPSAYATALRSAYSSKAGYVESILEGGIGYRTLGQRHKFYFDAQVGTLEGASNVDSSLVRSRLDLSVSCHWIFVLFQSDAKAASVD